MEQLRLTPTFSQNVIDSIELDKKLNNAYIISGKANGKTFLMSDCVSTKEDFNKNKTYGFTNKIHKLISPLEETYSCFSENSTYRLAMNYFDKLSHQQNVKFDFKNREHIEKVITIFKKLKADSIKNNYDVNNYCRMFFINKEDVWSYIIDGEGRLSILQNIKSENYYLAPNSFFSSPIRLKQNFGYNEELITFCKNEINSINKHNFSLKNRFSHIIFEKDTVDYYDSIDNYDEFILSETGGDFEDVVEKNNIKPFPWTKRGFI